MTRRQGPPSHSAIGPAVLFWVIASSVAVRADGMTAQPTVDMSRCGTPPSSRAETVMGPRLGLDASGARVVRRNSTFPRYPCADAPRRPATGLGGIEIRLETALPEAAPEAGGRGRGRR